MSMKIDQGTIQHDLDVVKTGLNNIIARKKQTVSGKATELQTVVKNAIKLQLKIANLFNKKLGLKEFASAELLREDFNDTVDRIIKFSERLKVIPGGGGKIAARKKQEILSHEVFERVTELKPITKQLKVDTLKLKRATMEKTPSKVATLRMKYETMGTPSKTDTVIMRRQSQAERRRSQTEDEINAVLNDIKAISQAEEMLLKTELPTLKSERAVLKEEIQEFRAKINKILKEFPRPGLLSPLQMAEIQFIRSLVKNFDKTFRQELRQAEDSVAGIRKVRDKIQKLTNVEQRLEQFESKYSAFFDTYISTMNVLTGILRSYPHLQDVRNEARSLMNQLQESIFDISTLEPWGDTILKLLRSDFVRIRGRLSIIYDKAQKLLTQAHGRLRLEDPRAEKMLAPIKSMIEALNNYRKQLEKEYIKSPILERCKELELECQSIRTKIYEIDEKHFGTLKESFSDLVKSFNKFKREMEQL